MIEDADEERKDISAHRQLFMEGAYRCFSDVTVRNSLYRRKWNVKSNTSISSFGEILEIDSIEELQSYKSEVAPLFQKVFNESLSELSGHEELKCTMMIEHRHRYYTNIDGVSEWCNSQWFEFTLLLKNAGFITDATSDSGGVINKLRSCLEELRDFTSFIADSYTGNLSAGIEDLVLSPTVTGILFHELIGHGGEENWFGLTYGHRIGPPGLFVTARHPGPGRFDDEGTPIIEIPLVQDGILLYSVKDRFTAKDSETVSGIAQVGSHRGMPRSRCTHITVGGGYVNAQSLINGLNGAIYCQGLGWAEMLGGVAVLQVTRSRRIIQGYLAAPLPQFTFVISLASFIEKLQCITTDVEVGRASRCVKFNDPLPSQIYAPTAFLCNVDIFPV